MRRRNFLAFGGPAWRSRRWGENRRAACCGLRLRLRTPGGRGGGAFDRAAIGPEDHGDEGVRRLADSQLRPAVCFVKLETNQGLVGWGEGTLEGKAGAAMACIDDFRDFVIGADPMQVEHIWQSMYVHSFYRAGPVMGSAISAIDQALWDIRGKALGMPVYRLAGRPVRSARRSRLLSRRRRAHAGALAKLRETAIQQGVSCFKTGIPGYYEWIETRKKIERAVQVDAVAARGARARISTSRWTSTPRPAPAWRRSW